MFRHGVSEPLLFCWFVGDDKDSQMIAYRKCI